MMNQRGKFDQRFGRRSFLKTSATGVGVLSLCRHLPNVSAQQASLSTDGVQFTDDIEPLVRLIETTPRDELIEIIAARITRDDLTYRELLAGLLLAGVRNVQPRPSVGFKFHAVLVVNSCHLASLAAPDSQRWLPLLWGVDYFKSSQQRDIDEGDWTMAPVDESKVPPANRAAAAFARAMETWDVEAADAAAAGIVRNLPSNHVFEILTRYAARDFRSIGHKAIYVANAYRTLNCIGWQYAEPVVRSLTYALLNHVGEPNPAESDLVPDRPYRENVERAAGLREDWAIGEDDEGATIGLLEAIREGASSDASDVIVQNLNQGASVKSQSDALYLASAELLMRQPGIVGLHTLTTTNAIQYLVATCRRDDTRRMLLLQNAAFLPMFRQEMERRGDVAATQIDQLEPVAFQSSDDGVDAIFDQMGTDRGRAAQLVLGNVQTSEDARQFMNRARQLVFLKGNDSHDYKFSSAVLEDYHHVSPRWQNHFLAASTHQLKSNQSRDIRLIDRIQSALG